MSFPYLLYIDEVFNMEIFQLSLSLLLKFKKNIVFGRILIDLMIDGLAFSFGSLEISLESCSVRWRV